MNAVKTIVGLVAVAAIAAVSFLLLSNAALDESEAKQITGQAPIVGTGFSLLNHKGDRVTDEMYKGKYLLIYFGYTNCPDICPVNLGSIAGAMEMFGPLSDEIVPIFVTIDPERDTVQKVAEYVALFDERLVGLTGSTEELADMAKGYRVFYEEYINKERGGGIVDFNHSSLTFLVGRDGKYMAHFPDGVEARTIALTATKLIGLREPDLEKPVLTN